MFVYVFLVFFRKSHLFISKNFESYFGFYFENVVTNEKLFVLMLLFYEEFFIIYLCYICLIYFTWDIYCFINAINSINLNSKSHM